MNMLGTSFLLAAAVLTTGCAHYEWQKSGSTQTDLGKDSYDCHTEAAKTYPPQSVTRQVMQGYSRNCQGTASIYGNGGYQYSNMDCTTNPGLRVEDTTTTEDLNAGNRNEASKQCMYARGWQLIQAK
ncbi:MAG TPA: hypothetical protein VLC92_06665 [Rhodocyclaceae bacterium]|nr:hypothetical protein [Rhodocyclaceae bacterium]